MNITNEQEDLNKKLEAKSEILFFTDVDNSEILKLCANGDIMVHGKMVENDKDVVEAMREFLRLNNLLD